MQEEIVLTLSEVLYNAKCLKRIYELDKDNPAKTNECLKNLSLQETYQEMSRILVEELIDSHPEWTHVGAYKVILDKGWAPKGLNSIPSNNNELSSKVAKDEEE